MFTKSIFFIAVLAVSCTAMEENNVNLEILKDYFDSLPAYQQVECLSRLAQPTAISSTGTLHKNISLPAIDDSLSKSLARQEDKCSAMPFIKTFLLSFKSCFECSYRTWQ
jgi:hypothetical protein